MNEWGVSPGGREERGREAGVGRSWRHFVKLEWLNLFSPNISSHFPFSSSFFLLNTHRLPGTQHRLALCSAKRPGAWDTRQSQARYLSNINGLFWEKYF